MPGITQTGMYDHLSTPIPAPSRLCTNQSSHVVFAGLQGCVEGLRHSIHVSLHPPLHSVLHFAGIVLHPEALPLQDKSMSGANVGETEGKESRPEKSFGNKQNVIWAIHTYVGFLIPHLPARDRCAVRDSRATKFHQKLKKERDHRGGTLEKNHGSIGTPPR